MRQKLLWVGMAWRLLIALILALCLVPVGSSPVAALSAEDLFQITYEVSLSKTAIQGNEVFYATIQGEARCKEDLEFPYSLVNEARITGLVTATHQASDAKVTLSSSYTVTIAPFPNKKNEIAQSSVVVSLQFPEESQSGTYSVVGESIEAKVTVLGIAIPATKYLPSFQIMGLVTYVASDGGGDGFGPTLTPTAEEVNTNLFGTEASFPISSIGEIMETIEAISEDGTITLTILEGTIALDKDDNPLTSLEADIDTSPPPPPKDISIIGLAYDFGPDEATFAPPITLTWRYDPNDIPEGVAEEDLELAWYDEATDKWVELDCVVDTRNNTITTSIEHFTTFAIIGMVTSAPGLESEVPTAIFRISEFDISPGEVDIGQAVTIHALVTNTGNLEGTYQVTLEIDNKAIETQKVTLTAGAKYTVIFKISEDIAGIYSVNINGLSGSFIVKPAATHEFESASTRTPPVKPINWPVVYGVVAAVVVIGSLLFFLARRSHTKSSS